MIDRGRLGKYVSVIALLTLKHQEQWALVDGRPAGACLTHTVFTTTDGTYSLGRGNYHISRSSKHKHLKKMYAHIISGIKLFILYVLEITSNAYVYFPTMRLHFSTRKRKRACLNNGSEARADTHSTSLLYIILRTTDKLHKWRRGSFWKHRLLTQWRILNKRKSRHRFRYSCGRHDIYVSDCQIWFGEVSA